MYDFAPDSDDSSADADGGVEFIPDLTSRIVAQLQTPKSPRGNNATAYGNATNYANSSSFGNAPSYDNATNYGNATSYSGPKSPRTPRSYGNSPVTHSSSSTAHLQAQLTSFDNLSNYGDAYVYAISKDAEKKLVAEGYGINEDESYSLEFSDSAPPEKAPVIGRSWNTEYQAIVDSSDLRGKEKFTKLSSLFRDFVETATMYAKILIGELCVDEDFLTIKPKKMGGVAGGKKFIVQDILFKFTDDTSNLYGSEKNAQKSAGHDLKGMVNYALANVEGLYFPMMCILQYLGFCITAMSMLPLSKDSLKYGSNDAGKTMHFDDPVLNQKMKEAGEKLLLKGHFAGTSKTHLTYGPGDLEAHQGSDGRYYLLDFARVFPAQAQIFNKKNGTSIFYELLRPELLPLYKSHMLEEDETFDFQGLSSDAFAGWGKYDPKATVHNEEVIGCTRFLFEQVIPKFVEDYSYKNTAKEKLTPSHQRSLCILMHKAGINLRHLGFLFRRLKIESCPVSAQDNVLIEMVARVIKNNIRKLWRNEVRNQRCVSVEKCTTQLVDTINILFCPEDQQSEFVPFLSVESYDIGEEVEVFDHSHNCYIRRRIAGLRHNFIQVEGSNDSVHLEFVRKALPALPLNFPLNLGDVVSAVREPRKEGDVIAYDEFHVTKIEYTGGSDGGVVVYDQKGNKYEKRRLRLVRRDEDGIDRGKWSKIISKIQTVYYLNLSSDDIEYLEPDLFNYLKCHSLLPTVVSRIFELLHVTTSAEKSFASLQNSGTTFRFLVQDIVSINVKSKQMFMMDFVDAKLLFHTFIVSQNSIEFPRLAKVMLQKLRTLPLWGSSQSILYDFIVQIRKNYIRFMNLQKKDNFKKNTIVGMKTTSDSLRQTGLELCSMALSIDKTNKDIKLEELILKSLKIDDRNLFVDYITRTKNPGHAIFQYFRHFYSYDEDFDELCIKLLESTLQQEEEVRKTYLYCLYLAFVHSTRVIYSCKRFYKNTFCDGRKPIQKNQFYDEKTMNTIMEYIKRAFALQPTKTVDFLVAELKFESNELFVAFRCVREKILLESDIPNSIGKLYLQRCSAITNEDLEFIASFPIEFHSIYLSYVNNISDGDCNKFLARYTSLKTLSLTHVYHLSSKATDSIWARNFILSYGVSGNIVSTLSPDIATQVKMFKFFDSEITEEIYSSFQNYKYPVEVEFNRCKFSPIFFEGPPREVLTKTKLSLLSFKNLGIEIEPLKVLLKSLNVQSFMLNSDQTKFEDFVLFKHNSLHRLDINSVSSYFSGEGGVEISAPNNLPNPCYIVNKQLRQMDRNFSFKKELKGPEEYTIYFSNVLSASIKPISPVTFEFTYTNGDEKVLKYTCDLKKQSNMLEFMKNKTTANSFLNQTSTTAMEFHYKFGTTPFSIKMVSLSNTAGMTHKITMLENVFEASWNATTKTFSFKFPPSINITFWFPCLLFGLIKFYNL